VKTVFVVGAGPAGNANGHASKKGNARAIAIPIGSDRGHYVTLCAALITQRSLVIRSFSASPPDATSPRSRPKTGASLANFEGLTQPPKTY
jgi:hypothetical protein